LQNLEALKGFNAAAKSQGLDFEYGANSKHYKTAWMAAHATDQHQLQADSTPLDTIVMEGGLPAPMSSPKVAQRSRAMSATVAGLRFLRNRLLRWASEEAGGQQGVSVSREVQWVQTAVLAGRVRHDTRDHTVLQTVHASPSFFGRPWFSYVQVRTGDDEGGAHSWFGQLVLLFKAKVKLGAAVPVEAREFAYVRWLEQLEAHDGDVLSKVGCDRFKWERGCNSADAYAVVELKTLLCRQYIVPAWGQQSLPANARCQFHASTMLEHHKEV
jgi:hypothetical protein